MSKYFIQRRCTIIAETEKAVLVKFKTKKNTGKHWIPRSQCNYGHKEANSMTGYEQGVVEVNDWYWDNVLKAKLK